MSKKPPSPYIAQAQGIGQQLQTQGTANIQGGVGAGQTAVDRPTQSPLYKALYSTEAGRMSSAYDQAAANTAARARQAGFGYQQPVAQGAGAELRGREASAIGQLPGQVAAESVPLELQQAGQQIGAGEAQLGQGTQMYGQAVPLEQDYQKYALSYTPAWQRMLGGAATAGLGLVPGGGVAGKLAKIGGGALG